MSNVYDRPGATISGLIFLITSVVLFIGAVGLFAWFLMDAVEEHFLRNVLFGSAFLVCTLGLLVYVLFIYRYPRACSAVLWTAMAIGTAAFVFGLCIKPKLDSTASLINPTYQLEYASLR